MQAFKLRQQNKKETQPLKFCGLRNERYETGSCKTRKHCE